MKVVDLTGQKFGRLTVLERVENDNRGQSMWLCKCECGNKTVKLGYRLKSGESKSCGCYRTETVTKHGDYSTRLYRIWRNIKTRCNCVNHKSYKRYGDRGITVCDEWNKDFSKFKEWAIANGYKDNLTIERIDNNGNYEPNNCRWATRKEQNNNTSRNRHITYNGETHTVMEWAQKLNIKYSTLSYRINSGWEIARALSTP